MALRVKTVLSLGAGQNIGRITHRNIKGAQALAPTIGGGDKA